MPHYHIDPEDFDDLTGGEIPDGFEPNFYESAEATIDFPAMCADSRRVREELLAAGFAAVTCTYDGGHDEGFAYFESASDADGVHPAAAVAARLKASGLIPEQSPWLKDALPPAAKEQLAAAWAGRSDEQKLRDVLVTFTEQLATELLGKGFGTGDYSMRGRFRCDLTTGELTDLEPDPPEPKHGSI